MRLAALLSLLLFLIGPSPTTAQQSEGVYYVDGSDAVVRKRPNVMSSVILSVPDDTTIHAKKATDSWYKVDLGSKSGYIVDQYLVPKHLRDYRERLRKQGFTISLQSQYITSNTADGISVVFSLRNISTDKVIKYASFTIKLFNPVGDPVEGQNGTSAKVTPKFVGPVKPGEESTVRFDNVWYSSVGRCVELHRIEVQHIDGSSFTYIDDLKSITDYASGVKLRGGCSYEAQQGSE